MSGAVMRDANCRGRGGRTGAGTLLVVAVAGVACSGGAGGGGGDAGMASSLPFAPAGPSAAPDPAVLGPYPVGVRTFTLVDPSRMTPGMTTPRTLVMEAWYPATEAARGATERYVLHEHLPESLKPQIAEEALGYLDTPALRDAEPASEGAPYPLVVFSHGKGGIRMQSTFFTAYLASHGFVVVSPDHEGDTLKDLLLEGDISPLSTLDKLLDRPPDISFILDHFANPPADEPLGGIVDMTRVGVAGHSLGALTALKVAGLDARIDAALAHTPVGESITQVDVPTPLSQYGIPVMLQGGDLDHTLPADPHLTSVYAALSAPRYALRLATAGHFTFSDLCVLDVLAIDAVLEQDISNVLDDGCGTQNIGPGAALPVIRNYSIGFFNRHLRGSAGSDAWLATEPGHALAGNTTEVAFTADP